MLDTSLMGYARANNENKGESGDVAAGAPDGGHIPQGGRFTVPTADEEARYQAEMVRQLKQIEPVYRLVHDLRQYISKCLLDEVHSFAPMETGFNVKSAEPANISAVVVSLEKTAKLLNAFYERMEGPPTENLALTRRISLKLQTALESFVLNMKRIAPDGDLGQLERPEFLDNLLNLQITLGNEEVNLEILRGHIS